MLHWIYRSPTQSSELPPSSIGIARGCLYCKAKEQAVPQFGQRILFLASVDSAQTGVRIDGGELQLRPEQFAVMMNYEPENRARVVGV